MLGLIAVDAAVRSGAAEVVAVDRDVTRLKWAPELGAIVPDSSTDGDDTQPELLDITLEFSDSDIIINYLFGPSLDEYLHIKIFTPRNPIK